LLIVVILRAVIALAVPAGKKFTED